MIILEYKNSTLATVCQAVIVLHICLRSVTHTAW